MVQLFFIQLLLIARAVSIWTSRLGIPAVVAYAFYMPAQILSDPGLGVSSEPEINKVLSGYGLYVSAILIFTVWIYASRFAAIAAKALYSKEGTTSVRFGNPSLGLTFSGGAGLAVFLAATSYLITLYGFALLYFFVSFSAPKAFNVQIADIVSAMYFSAMTIATVGYGDIVPQSPMARLLVTAEVLIGVAYSVFFFSIAAGALRDSGRNVH